MKEVKEMSTIDAVAGKKDVFEIELQEDITGGIKLYVHCNGQTILRIGKISSNKVLMTPYSAWLTNRATFKVGR